MKVAISLKQLRTDPREYVRLLRSGYAVSITEHRRELVSARAESSGHAPVAGDIRELLDYARKLPVQQLTGQNDTVADIKHARKQYLEERLGGRP